MLHSATTAYEFTGTDDGYRVVRVIGAGDVCERKSGPPRYGVADSALRTIHRGLVENVVAHLPRGRISERSHPGRRRGGVRVLPSAIRYQAVRRRTLRTGRAAGLRR